MPRHDFLVGNDATFDSSIGLWTTRTAYVDPATGVVTPDNVARATDGMVPHGGVGGCLKASLAMADEATFEGDNIALRWGLPLQVAEYGTPSWSWHAGQGPYWQAVEAPAGSVPVSSVNDVFDLLSTLTGTFWVKYVPPTTPRVRLRWSNSTRADWGDIDVRVLGGAYGYGMYTTLPGDVLIICMSGPPADCPGAPAGTVTLFSSDLFSVLAYRVQVGDGVPGVNLTFGGASGYEVNAVITCYAGVDPAVNLADLSTAYTSGSSADLASTLPAAATADDIVVTAFASPYLVSGYLPQVYVLPPSTYPWPTPTPHKPLSQPATGLYVTDQQIHRSDHPAGPSLAVTAHDYASAGPVPWQAFSVCLPPGGDVAPGISMQFYPAIYVGVPSDYENVGSLWTGDTTTVNPNADWTELTFGPWTAHSPPLRGDTGWSDPSDQSWFESIPPPWYAFVSLIGYYVHPNPLDLIDVNRYHWRADDLLYLSDCHLWNQRPGLDRVAGWSIGRIGMS